MKLHLAWLIAGAFIACGGDAVVFPDGSGGSGGGSSGSGSSGAGAGMAGGSQSGGATGDNCDELANAYLEALEGAKACAPSSNVEQCTDTVNNALPCPCPTFINPKNTDAVDQLGDLQTAWNTAGCGLNITCPAVECPLLDHARCSSSDPGSDGSCQDEK